MELEAVKNTRVHRYHFAKTSSLGMSPRDCGILDTNIEALEAVPSIKKELNTDQVGVYEK